LQVSARQFQEVTAYSNNISNAFNSNTAHFSAQSQTEKRTTVLSILIEPRIYFVTLFHIFK